MKFGFALERSGRSRILELGARLARQIGFCVHRGSECGEIERVESEIDVEKRVGSEGREPRRIFSDLVRGDRQKNIPAQSRPAIQTEREVLNLDVIFRDADERGQVGALVPEMKLPKENTLRRIVRLQLDVEWNQRASGNTKISGAQLERSRAAVVRAAAFPFRGD